jgi:protein AroM
MNVGFVTIGQAPRDDITPLFQQILGKDHRYDERGGLDGLSESEIRQLGPDGGEEFFVTRLRDRRVVRVSKARMRDRVQSIVAEMGSDENDLIVILCTGPFPGLQAQVPILIPDIVMRQLTLGIMPAGRLGVISPTEEQIPMLRDKWQPYPSASFATASPYGEASQVAQAAAALRASDLIILDGMAYTPAMKRHAREASGRPILLPQEVLAHCALMLA